jgi:hypothetical protein
MAKEMQKEIQKEIQDVNESRFNPARAAASSAPAARILVVEDEAAQHFMPVAADEAVRSFEVDQRHPRAVADDDVPVGTLQRRPNRDRRRDRASARGTARQR